MAYYLDTSAAVKLVVREPGSTGLARWAAGHADTVVSSDLLRTELLRATRRGAPELMPRAWPAGPLGPISARGCRSAPNRATRRARAARSRHDRHRRMEGPG